MSKNKVNRIYVPTASAEDWRRFLAEPEKQWRTGFSAKELAECWERANGFPKEVREVFASSDDPDLRKMEMLLAIPEYKVDLPGGKRPSQNDLFVLARTESGKMSVIMVEGKVNEPFGETLDTWLSKKSAGKEERLAFLCDTLGLTPPLPGNIRYQLLHRGASAVIEAKRFSARYAIMLVHSFSKDRMWFEDYQDFISLFKPLAQTSKLQQLKMLDLVTLYCGWACGVYR